MVGFNSAFLVLALCVISAAQARPGDQQYDALNQYGVETLDERVAKLEKRLSGEVFMDMNTRLDQMQNDVQRLRGQVEELTHELESLKKRQQDMYIDLDKRVPPAGVQPPAVPDGGVTDPGAVPTEGTVTPPPPAEPNDSAARKAAYDQAFNLLNNSKYPEAVKEFKRFLSIYPSGEYADNAQYWMGESYYVIRDFTAAKDAFRKVVQNFPQSPKTPDAMLKLGFIEYETNQWTNARNTLNDVVKNYAGTSAAQQAAKRLAKMKQEGH